MALSQKRPYEADLYVQLEPGDQGYIDPDELQVMVDHPSFVEPKRLPLTQVGVAGTGQHIESGEIRGLSSRFVNVEFETAFTVNPVGRKNIHVYRVELVGNNKTVDQQVLFHGVEVTTLGFSLTIDETESLTGVVIEYLFL